MSFDNWKLQDPRTLSCAGHCVYTLPNHFLLKVSTSTWPTCGGCLEAGIISKSPIKGKYRLMDEFVDSLKSEMTEGMPRGIFIHFPDLRVFDISGIEEWTEEELDRYMRRLKARWTIRTKQAGRVEAVQ